MLNRELVCFLINNQEITLLAALFDQTWFLAGKLKLKNLKGPYLSGKILVYALIVKFLITTT